MFKSIIVAAAVTALSTQAFAGTLVFEAPVEQEVMVEEAAPMGGSNAAWIVPLIAVAVIAIALSGGDDEETEETPCGKDISTAC